MGDTGVTVSRERYHILEKNALSKECKLCEENCTHTHKKAKVSI